MIIKTKNGNKVLETSKKDWVSTAKSRGWTITAGPGDVPVRDRLQVMYPRKRLQIENAYNEAHAILSVLNLDSNDEKKNAAYLAVRKFFDLVKGMDSGIDDTISAWDRYLKEKSKSIGISTMMGDAKGWLKDDPGFQKRVRQRDADNPALQSYKDELQSTQNNS